MLSALRRIHRAHPRWTLSQCAVLLEVIVAEQRGQPHTHQSICERLRLPKSTASAVISSLVREGRGPGVLLFEPDPKDRRRRLLAANSSRLDLDLDETLRRAMIDYYGNSVFSLTARSPDSPPPS